MAVEGITYTQYCYGINNPKALETMLNLERAVEQGAISYEEFSSTVETLTGKKVKPYYTRGGQILGYNLIEPETFTTSNPINSNTSTVARGTISRPVTSTINASGKGIIQGMRNIGGKVAFGSALVGTAAMCVGTGITLGKTVDGVLYNLNPDFFDSNGLGALNPDTWSTITAGDDSLGASVLNVLFGFDENNKAQAYIDENAFAYFASYMQNKGVFASNYSTVTEEPSIYWSSEIPSLPLYFIDVDFSTMPYISSLNRYAFKFGTRIDGTTYKELYVLSKYPILARIGYYILSNRTRFTIFGILLGEYVDYGFQSAAYYDERWEVDIYTELRETRLDDKTAYWSYMSFRYNDTVSTILEPSANQVNLTSLNGDGHFCWCLRFCDYISGGGVEGITTQPSATIPQNLTGNPITDLPLLQNQYPDIFNNGIDYPVIQPDGTVKNYHYVPVNLPESFERVGVQPESGTATQTDTQIDPLTAPKELIDTLTKILSNPMPETKTELDNDNPPENPIDTGEGSSPVPIVPVGSASALWKIYHPTQAQVDQFGGWLWSSAFVDQLLKIFNNPMESIIGLHKVYATPIDAGNTTIKVGYLDSQVPSAYIEEQYITVDCGSVDLYEVFGNVFDYSPFTDVNLYLPFVGIVRLDVSDVMRSTISIKYGVDVLTGACLAMVTVSRDGYDSILYQYSGNCAVQYPISSGSYMGIVSSIISVAGGVAATIATGGGAAPLALGVAGGAMSAHTNVQHSGSFSGNAGAMGGKIPYLIISRPQTKLNSNYSEMEGTPNNHYVTVGECSGYIEARAVHVINVNATDTELDEIQSLLMNGIII